MMFKARRGILQPRQRLASVPFALVSDRLGTKTLAEVQADIAASIGTHAGDASAHPWMPTGSGNIHFSGGKVGIGTTSPERNLDVRGAIRTNDFLDLKHDGSAHQYALGPFYDQDDFHLAHTTDGFITHEPYLTVLGSSGNVGIGTAAPTALLHLRSGAPFLKLEASIGTNYVQQDFVNTGGSVRIGAENGAGGGLLSGTSPYAGVFGTIGAYPLQLSTGNSIRTTIESDGDVGIGTANPGARLEVVQSSNTEFAARFYNSGGDGPGVKIQAGDIGSTPLNPILWVGDGTGTTPAMVVKGGNDPSLTLFGPNRHLNLYMLGTGPLYDQAIHFTDDASDWTVGNKWTSENPNGFGIGRNNERKSTSFPTERWASPGASSSVRRDRPDRQLPTSTFVAATFPARPRIILGGDRFLSVEADATHFTGTVQANELFAVTLPPVSGAQLCTSVGPAGMIGTCSSSIEFKRDVQDLQLEGLTTIDQLRPVQFTWKENGDPDLGLIAEEVGEVAPQLVTRDETSGRVIGVKYPQLTAILLKALQEQRAEFEAFRKDQERLVARLAEELRGLKERLDSEDSRASSPE